jgi:hypothetical protein
LTAEERLEILRGFRFTDRQARFLSLVMRHAGVCVPRQYASFAGIANGGQRVGRARKASSSSTRTSTSLPWSSAAIRSSTNQREG